MLTGGELAILAYAHRCRRDFSTSQNSSAPARHRMNTELTNMSKSAKGPAQPLLHHDVHDKGGAGDRVDHKASAAAAVAIELEIAAQVRTVACSKHASLRVCGIWRLHKVFTRLPWVLAD